MERIGGHVEAKLRRAAVCSVTISTMDFEETIGSPIIGGIGAFFVVILYSRRPIGDTERVVSVGRAGAYRQLENNKR
jgi:hypothetical protein